MAPIYSQWKPWSLSWPLGHPHVMPSPYSLCSKRLPHGSFSDLGTPHARACTQVVPLPWMLLPREPHSLLCHCLQVFNVKSPLDTLSNMSCFISITLFFLTAHHLPIGSILYLTNFYSLFLCHQLACMRQNFLFCIVSS